MYPLPFIVLLLILDGTASTSTKNREMDPLIYEGEPVADVQRKFTVVLSITADEPAPVPNPQCLGALIQADTVLTSRECLKMLDHFKKLSQFRGNDEIWAMEITPKNTISNLPQKRRVGYHSDKTSGTWALLYLAAPFTFTGLTPIEGGLIPSDTAEIQVIGLRKHSSQQQQNATDTDSSLYDNSGMAELSVTTVKRKPNQKTQLTSYANGAWSTLPTKVSMYDSEEYFFTENAACEMDWGSLYVTGAGTSEPRLVGIGTTPCIEYDLKDASFGPKECSGNWVGLLPAPTQTGRVNVPELGCGDVNSFDIVVAMTMDVGEWILASTQLTTFVPKSPCMNGVALLSQSDRAAESGITICTSLTAEENDKEWNEIHVNIPKKFRLTYEGTKVKRIMGFTTVPEIKVQPNTNTIQLRWLDKPDFIDPSDDGRMFVFEISGIHNPNDCDASSQIQLKTWNCPHPFLHKVSTFPNRECLGEVVTKTPTPSSFTYPSQCSLCNACYHFVDLPGGSSYWKCEHEGREFIRESDKIPAEEECFDRGLPPLVNNLD